MPVADFGPLVTEVDVDRMVLTTLRLWLPTYLAQVERERQLVNRTLARPTSYANAIDEEGLLDHRLPAIIVTTAQTQGEPEFVSYADAYNVTFSVVVSSVVRGRTPAEAREVAALVSACVRRVMVQQPDLGGQASGTRWTGSSVAPVTDSQEESRHLAVGLNEFLIHVDEAISVDGPTLPDPIYDDPDPVGAPDAPYDSRSAVSNVTIEVTGVPVTSEPGS